ncbi:MAG: ribose-phosphate pyrophosphokinase [Lachnospiraceae bacterium]|nr:ribose-phosphate pyrophosphokinase [Candidatus Minthocola equi]
MTKVKQPQDAHYVNSIPIGKLGIVALPGTEDIAERIDAYIAMWRSNRELDYDGYHRDSYLVENCIPRFGSGEAKGMIKQSVRGDDLYILADVTNYSVTYKMFGRDVPLSPDDHFQNIKRIVAAASGKAKRITVIMPFLYESRQHRRTARESLDCAIALQELTHIGVSTIITFDAHDPRVENAIPYDGFETINPTYQNIKALLKAVKDLQIDPQHMMVISPDEGAIGRAIELSNYLGLDIGMFYKRRDYSRIVDGKNPIVAHEFLGSSVEGKDVIIVDDMIASGDSLIDVARQLKARKANRVFAFATFGLFTKGMEVFDKAVEEGVIDKIFTSNSIYQSPETLSRKYYNSVDLSKYIALIIDNMNHDASIEPLLYPHSKIEKRLADYKAKQAKAK